MAETRCPRCGGAFRCGIDEPGPCACTALALTPAMRAEIARRFAGCLCVGCLAAIAHGEPYERQPTFIPAPQVPR
jgi:hypothetical protein